MVRKAAGEYSKTKEEQLSQAVKVAFDWFSTCYGAFAVNSLPSIHKTIHLKKMNTNYVIRADGAKVCLEI